MGQKKWTEEQETFLWEYLPDYRGRTITKNYQDFWKKVHLKFFERWPERAAIFKDLSPLADGQTLTVDQTRDLAEAIETRKKVAPISKTCQLCTDQISANYMMVPLANQWIAPKSHKRCQRSFKV
jgi:hypothetical protein